MLAPGILTGSGLGDVLYCDLAIHLDSSCKAACQRFLSRSIRAVKEESEKGTPLTLDIRVVGATGSMAILFLQDQHKSASNKILNRGQSFPLETRDWSTARIIDAEVVFP